MQASITPNTPSSDIAWSPFSPPLKNALDMIVMLATGHHGGVDVAQGVETDAVDVVAGVLHAAAEDSLLSIFAFSSISAARYTKQVWGPTASQEGVDWKERVPFKISWSCLRAGMPPNATKTMEFLVGIGIGSTPTPNAGDEAGNVRSRLDRRVFDGARGGRRSRG